MFSGEITVADDIQDVEQQIKAFRNFNIIFRGKDFIVVREELYDHCNISLFKQRPSRCMHCHQAVINSQSSFCRALYHSDLPGESPTL